MSMERDNLIEQIKKAISDLFGDIGVLIPETKADLNDIRSYIDILIDSLP